jgi:hypothetical protein
MAGINYLAFELSGVHAAVQYGSHQVKQGAADRSIGFRERFNGALFFGAVAQDGDKVSFRFAFLRWHARSPQGDSDPAIVRSRRKTGGKFSVPCDY